MARVKYTVIRLLSEGKLTMEGYVESTKFRNQVEALIVLNQLYKDAFGSTSPIEGLIPPKRISMIEVASVSSSRAVHKRAPEIPNDDSLLSLGGTGIVEVSDTLAKHLKEGCGGKVLPGDVILDAPGKKVDELGEVCDDSGTPTPIQQLSEPIRHLGPNWQRHVKKVRVFVTEKVAVALGNQRVRSCIAEAMGWRQA